MPRVRQPPKEELQPYYEVDRLLSKRLVKGSAEYLVKWKGYGDEGATWEAAANLTSILDLVLEF
jgi:hypothetical protein